MLAGGIASIQRRTSERGQRTLAGLAFDTPELEPGPDENRLRMGGKMLRPTAGADLDRCSVCP
jgi:hypothetical protein